MINGKIDLRSDTVTVPTDEMRKAMFEAVVGDDVYGDDATVNELERLTAERFGKEAPILLTGISMGATTVLMSAGTPYDANVRGIIADCGFTSPWEIIASVVRGRGLPIFPFVPLMSMWARIFAGFGFREYSTLEAVRRLQLPIFLAHGEADRFVPCHMTEKVYEACGSSDKTLLLVPDARHGAAYLVDRCNYENMIAQFVDRCL